MPSVQEELEALRKKKAVATHANVLRTKGGLSTPEQEEAALRKKAERDRQINYTKDAEKILKAGVKDAGLEVQFDMEQAKKKKEDASKKMEATQKLQSFRGFAEPGPGVPKPAASPGVTPRNLEAGFATPRNNKTETDAVVSEPAKETEEVVDVKSEEKATEVVTAEDAVPDMEEDVVPDMEEDAVPDMGDDAVPELGVDPAAAVQQQQQLEQLQQQQVRQPNRAEKKIRKAMQRLGMRPISGIARVTLKMAGKGNSYFAIHKPDVFEKNGTYIVFGEAMQGGGGAAQQQQATQAQAAQKFTAPPVAATTAAPALSAVTEEAEGDDEAVDESGVEPKDIALVMSQASCSRAQAVTALKENGGDLVNAIMSLTT